MSPYKHNNNIDIIRKCPADLPTLPSAWPPNSPPCTRASSCWWGGRTPSGTSGACTWPLSPAVLPPSGFHLQLQLQLLQLLPLACDALPSAFLPDEAVCREGTRGRGERRGRRGERGERGEEGACLLLTSITAMPIDSKNTFKKCVIITDCYEVFCERPTSLMARAQITSNLIV